MKKIFIFLLCIFLCSCSNIKTEQPINIIEEYVKTLLSQKIYLLYDDESKAVFMITPSEYDKENSTYNVYHENNTNTYYYRDDDYSIQYAIVVLSSLEKIDWNSFELKLYSNTYSSDIQDKYIPVSIIRDEKSLDDIDTITINNKHYLLDDSNGIVYKYYGVEKEISFIPLDNNIQIDIDNFDYRLDESNDSPRHINIEYITDNTILITTLFDFDGEHDYNTAKDILIIHTDNGDNEYILNYI